MSTRHLIDPELLQGLDYMPMFEFSADSLPGIRAAMDAAVASQPPDDRFPVDVDIVEIGGGDGQPMQLRVYQPRDAARPAPAVMHMHGGGFVMGTALMGDALYRRIAAEVGAVVVSVDYRLAPETRYPGQIEDCYAALRWLHDAAATLDVDPARIAVRGDSAGAGLAACLALMARDRGGPAICYQQLLGPMLDDRTGSTDAIHPVVGEYVWGRAANSFSWEALLGAPPGGQDTPPYAAAARAADLSGLPPSYVSSAGLDLFLEEDLSYAMRLVRAGVPTEVHVYPGAYHGFEFNTEAQVVKACVRDSITALQRLFERR